VERFSDFAAGQNTAIDSALSQALLRDCIVAERPGAGRVLDVGCGAGNFTLRLVERLQLSQIALVDLSRPMLERAVERLSAATQAQLTVLQGDVRDVPLPQGGFDVAVAGAVLHHLRGDDEWAAIFRKLHAALAPGGLLAVYDLVDHDSPGVREVMWAHYRAFLVTTLGEEAARGVFHVLDTEDSPRGLMWQLRLLEQCGFEGIEIVHKHSTFAAFLARRSVSRSTSVILGGEAVFS
jgi:tRNA (cmo5U34)-methyltransferase